MAFDAIRRVNYPSPMSRFREIPARRLILSLLISAIAAAAVISDWPAGLTDDFWARHSMASGIVSGIILFLLAAFVVEEWIRYRERQQWSRVSQVAYKVLAHILRQQGQYLHLLVSGRVPNYSPIFPVDRGAVEECVAEVDRLKSVPEVPPSDRLEELCADPVWRRVAYALVRQVRLTATASLSEWTGVMLQTAELAGDFNKVAGAVDTLSPLQRLLNDERLKSFDVEGQVRDPDGNWVIQFAEQFEFAQLATIAASEDLHRAINDVPEFKSGQRRWLSRESLSKFSARDRAWAERGMIIPFQDTDKGQ